MTYTSRHRPLFRYQMSMLLLFNRGDTYMAAYFDSRHPPEHGIFDGCTFR